MSASKAKNAAGRKNVQRNHPPVISGQPVSNNRASNELGTSTGKPGRP